MRKDWEYKKFEECISKVPKTPKIQSSAYNQGSKYPIISQEENALISGFCDDESLLFHIERPVVIFGDHTRALKYIDFDFAIGADGVKVILPKAFLNAKFLLYYLKWYNIPNLGYSRHYKLLKEVFVPIPTTEKQLAIVAELDKINELIQLKKQQLEDYDQLAQSIFYEMFGDPVENEKGWEVKKLREIALEKMSYGSGASAVPYNQKIRYIRITDIDELGCLKKDIVSPNICEDKYLLSDGDILFARSGATVGKTFLFKSTYGSCIYAGYLIRLRPNTQIVIPEYIYHYTKTHYYRSFIESNQRVVAQPNINAQQYSSLKLPLPPLPLQQQFAARIEAIERQKQQVSETIKDLETLLASRMQYWFD